MIKDLIIRNRSYRRFYQSEAISMDTLGELVDLARQSPSLGNQQPLKYILSCEPKKNAAIYQYLGWAAYLKDWGGPSEGEKPSAYIIMLGDKNINPSINCDHGIAAQSILLGAVEKGLGGCILASIKRELLRQELQIDPAYEILLVIALGKPKETIVLEPLGVDGNFKYWRDKQDVHHVPKRSLDEIIIQ